MCFSLKQHLADDTSVPRGAAGEEQQAGDDQAVDHLHLQVQQTEPVREAGQDQQDGGPRAGRADRGTEGHAAQIRQHPPPGQDSQRTLLQHGSDTGSRSISLNRVFNCD